MSSFKLHRIVAKQRYDLQWTARESIENMHFSWISTSFQKASVVECNGECYLSRRNNKKNKEKRNAGKRVPKISTWNRRQCVAFINSNKNKSTRMWRECDVKPFLRCVTVIPCILFVWMRTDEKRHTISHVLKNEKRKIWFPLDRIILFIHVVLLLVVNCATSWKTLPKRFILSKRWLKACTKRMKNEYTLNWTEAWVQQTPP